MKKIPGSRSAPPGLEWVILRRLPRVTIALVVGLLILRWGAGVWLEAGVGAGAEALRVSHQLDFVFYGLAFTLAFFMGVIAIACVIVSIAKGPQYTADSYPLSDADRPR